MIDCLNTDLPVLMKLEELFKREDEKVRKSVLYAVTERIQAYPDRKVEVKSRIGEKLKGQVGVKFLSPTCRHTPYPLCSRYEFQTSSKG